MNVGIVVHFIDAKYKLRTFLLSLPHISGRHTGVNQSELLKEIIYEFGIGDKLGFFITDNADNNDTCIYDLAGELALIRTRFAVVVWVIVSILRAEIFYLVMTRWIRSVRVVLLACA